MNALQAQVTNQQTQITSAQTSINSLSTQITSVQNVSYHTYTFGSSLNTGVSTTVNVGFQRIGNVVFVFLPLLNCANGTVIVSSIKGESGDQPLTLTPNGTRTQPLAFSLNDVFETGNLSFTGLREFVWVRNNNSSFPANANLSVASHVFTYFLE